jgi:hypothetical protein
MGVVDRERGQIRGTMVVQGGSRIMLFSLYSSKHHHGFPEGRNYTMGIKAKIPYCTLYYPV